MLLSFTALVLAATSSAPFSVSHVSKVNRAAITYVVNQHYGTHTYVRSIAVADSYALVWGTRGAMPFYDGLLLHKSGWWISCAAGQAPPSAAHLQTACGFPRTAAVELTEEQNANIAATRGDFGLAVIAEVRAHNAVQRASAFEQTQERGRLQLLQRLKVQMQLGQITRAQAIQRWNEFQIYF